MSREATILLGGIVAALLVVLVLGAGLGAFGTTVIVDEGPAGPSVPVNPPTDGSSGVVFDLRLREAGKFLGIQYRRAEHHAAVAVVVPPECVRVTDSGEELRDDGECADLPIRGKLSGGGGLGTGEQFVFVDVPVSRDCFASLQPGDPWPADGGPCTGE